MLKGVNVFIGEQDLKDNGNQMHYTSDKFEGWITARPIGYISLWHRIKCAWLVFREKADIVIWKYQ